MRAVTGWLGLTLAVAGVAAPAPSAASAQAPVDKAPVKQQTVTLISGDQLLISVGGDTATRRAAAGRDEVPLVSRTLDGRLEVVPADAVELLGADRLDRRLFDVTELLADGNDGSRGHLPLIITLAGTPGAASVVRQAVGPGQVRELDTIDSLAVRVDADRLAETWARLLSPAVAGAYRKIWLDGTARPSIDVSVPLVGAPAAWAAGFTGRDVGVGVLDTGIDGSHPDLAQGVAAAVDFTDDADGIDRAGHGTHVASVIAGTGAASAGRYRGMAPDARLYSAKVCRIASCAESAILAGMQWAARDQSLRVVNLSFGRPDQPGDDLLELAVATLSERYGTLFVAAAGTGTGAVSSPASAPAALAVGSSTMDDEVVATRDRTAGAGTGAPGRGPDLLAPGVDIVAARSGDSRLPRIAGGGPYTRLSGTSTAAPHVTGAAAMLAEQHPDWPADRLKAALTGSATALAGTGAGRLDVARAVTTTVTTRTSGVVLDRPGSATVTYANADDAPVLLTLTPPPGLPVTLAQDMIEVPAHGSATVQLTAGPPPSPGRVTGALTATAASSDVTIRVPVTVGQPAPRAELTVVLLDRTGSPAARTFGAVHGAESAALPGTGGNVTLPRGTYTLDAKIFDRAGITLLNRPRLVLDGDTTVVLDARLGTAMTVPGGGQTTARVAFSTPTGAGSVQARSFDTMYAAQLGPAPAGFRTELAATWPDRALSWSVPGGYVTGPAAPALEGITLGPAATPGHLRVELRHGRGSAPATRFDLRVSDDGDTWRRPMMVRVGDVALVALPPRTGPLAVRVSATDSAGNTLDQTLRTTYAAAARPTG